MKKSYPETESLRVELEKVISNFLLDFPKASEVHIAATFMKEDFDNGGYYAGTQTVKGHRHQDSKTLCDMLEDYNGQMLIKIGTTLLHKSS